MFQPTSHVKLVISQQAICYNKTLLKQQGGQSSSNKPVNLKVHIHVYIIVPLHHTSGLHCLL